LPAIRHGLTHFEWTLAPLRWQLPVQLSAADWTALSGGLPEGRWVDDAEALSLGLPAPVRKLLLEAEKSGATAPERNK
jgi:A/G-specific adenine glycosylase